MNDVDSFIRVSVITKDNNLIHLDLVCNKEWYCLRDHFRSTEEMEKYISDNTEDAFKMSIRKIDNSSYILNCDCDTKEDGLMSYERWIKLQGKKIIKFMPVIKKFMVDAVTGNLPIMENDDNQETISL
ncbi:MAG: hypothetical protein IKX36_08185 [Prevotella sp.]|nr:hypothetical protein [Prevotella sp.]